MIKSRITAIILLTATLAFTAGHYATNCGEVYNPDATHQHECWIIKPGK